MQQMSGTWNHGSSVTLFSNGKHVCSISEERLSKIKYDGNFPRKSIDYCLNYGNLQPEDIDLVVVPSMGSELFYQNYINGTLNSKIKRKFPNANVEVISHHLSHAYSSVFSCDYNEGTFVTIDGAGSLMFKSFGNPFTSETHSMGYFNKEKGIFRFHPGVPGLNNFGHYYWIWAHHIYSQKINKNINIIDPKYRETYCGKVMGLSAYGNTKEFPQDYRMAFDGIPAVTFTSVPGNDYSYGNVSAENKAKILQHNFENGMLEYMK